MDIEKKLELLKKIQKVEAPPFLHTRIMERIDTSANFTAPVYWRLAFVATAIIILSINAAVLFKLSTKPSSDGMEKVFSSMELSTTNDLYP